MTSLIKFLFPYFLTDFPEYYKPYLASETNQKQHMTEIHMEYLLKNLTHNDSVKQTSGKGHTSIGVVKKFEQKLRCRLWSGVEGYRPSRNKDKKDITIQC